jgi:uncharacterized protein YecT (DUF1311 family)
MVATIMRSLLCLVLLVSFAWADLNSPEISDEEYKQYIETSNEFEMAEKDINGIYKELMSVLSKPKKIILRDEQREWIKTRDTKAFSEGQKGSQIYIDALTKITIQRKSELEARLLKLTHNPVATEVSPAPQKAEAQNIQQKSELPTQSTQQTEGESENQTVKYIIIALLLISVISVFLHFNGKLVIYKDYTDAAITIGSVIGTIVIFYICIFLDLSEAASWTVSLLFFFSIFLFVFRMTYITNNNIFFTIFSLLTKYTIIFLYAILMLGPMFSSSIKEGESSVDFELRKQRQELQNKLFMVVILAVLVWFVNITTKIKVWSPLGDYFSMSFKK